MKLMCDLQTFLSFSISHRSIDNRPLNVPGNDAFFKIRNEIKRLFIKTKPLILFKLEDEFFPAF